MRPTRRNFRGIESFFSYSAEDILGRLCTVRKTLGVEVMQRSHVEARQALRLRAHPPLCGISPWLEEQFDHAGEKRKGAIAVKQKTVIVNDRMQQGYRYVLVAPTGRNFEQDFRPDLSPPEMLRLGIFGGKYMTDCKDEFPHSWFAQAKLSPKHADTSLNYFGVDSSQSLSVWRKKGWIYPDDPRGWFQWYCRYYLGRRLPAEDARQIRRWKAIRRHVGQLQMNCEPGDISCRKRQRQALLHWAYDSRKL